MRVVTDDTKDNIPIKVITFVVYIRDNRVDLRLRRQQTDRQAKIRLNKENQIRDRPRKKIFFINPKEVWHGAIDLRERGYNYRSSTKHVVSRHVHE